MNRAGPTHVEFPYFPDSRDTRRPSVYGSSTFVSLVKRENEFGPLVPLKKSEIQCFLRRKLVHCIWVLRRKTINNGKKERKRERKKAGERKREREREKDRKKDWKKNGQKYRHWSVWGSSSRPWRYQHHAMPTDLTDQLLGHAVLK